MATIVAPELCSLGAHARKRHDCHRQGQAGSSMRAAIVARRRLDLAATMVVQLSMDLDVIFIMFELLCTFGDSL